MESQKNRITSFLEQKGLKLKWIVNEEGTNVAEQLKREVVDIALLDQNINEVKGLDVLNELRAENDLTDVLLYSAVPDQEVALDEARRATFTEVVEGREIASRLELLIEKNIQKWEDVEILRGIVISKVIELELAVNEFFISYLKIPEIKIEEFRSYILENSYLSFEGKKQTIEKLAKKKNKKSETKKLVDQLEKLQKERNNLAHCKRDPDNKNQLIKMGSPEKYTKERINKILIMIKNVRIELQGLEEIFSQGSEE